MYTSNSQARGEVIGRGLASKCPGDAHTENTGSVGIGSSFGAARQKRATHPLMGLRMVRGLALALLALTSIASADSLDIIVGTQQIRYVGTMLSIDQVSTGGEVHFDATELTTTPWPPMANLAKLSPFPIWTVHVGSNAGIPEFDATFCQFQAQAYIAEGGMHFSLRCAGEK